MASQIIAPSSSGAPSSACSTPKAAQEKQSIASDSEVTYYAGLDSSRRSSLAHEMASEVLEHYSRARTLVMLLANSLRDQGDESMELDLAEVADAWMNDGSHISQERRLMACLQATKEASHV